MLHSPREKERKSYEHKLCNHKNIIPGTADISSTSSCETVIYSLRPGSDAELPNLIDLCHAAVILSQEIKKALFLRLALDPIGRSLFLPSRNLYKVELFSAFIQLFRERLSEKMCTR